jgi:hypothetical protein
MRRALSGMLLGMLLLAPSAGAVQALPQGIQTLYYSRGVMERVLAAHMNPRNAGRGDYVLGLHRRAGVDCLTAVNWQSRHLVFQNKVLVIDFYDRVQKRWERHNCLASDWQQRRHSTGNRQRFEIDWNTAQAVHAVPGNTVARLVAIR